MPGSRKTPKSSKKRKLAAGKDTTDSLLPLKQIQQAVDAVLELRKKEEESQDLQLFEGEVDMENDPVEKETSRLIYLGVTLAKPDENVVGRFRPHSFALPFPLIEVNKNLEVCVIVRDQKKDEFKTFVEGNEELAFVKEVLSVTQLKKSYGGHKERAKLSMTYDLFLVDSVWEQEMPSILGQKFMKGPKQFLSVKLFHKEKEVDRLANMRKVITDCHVFLRGVCTNVKVARVGMSSDHICSNIVKSIEELKGFIPGGVDNIQSLFLRYGGGMPVPLYSSAPTDIPVSTEKEADDAEKSVKPLHTPSKKRIKV